jgi:menaquinol-cytochrome c reductase cytochrome b/c subunit
LPSEGPTGLGLATPSVVQAQGQGAVARFKAGEAVVASSGCLACHRIGDAGNDGPGPDLTQVGSRLPLSGIARVLVKPTAPMPSFGRMAESKRRDLVYFLAQLR